eukprot:5127074-Pleurochrysis_carterae.AAC.3
MPMAAKLQKHLAANMRKHAAADHQSCARRPSSETEKGKSCTTWKNVFSIFLRDANLQHYTKVNRKSGAESERSSSAGTLCTARRAATVHTALRAAAAHDPHQRKDLETDADDSNHHPHSIICRTKQQAGMESAAAWVQLKGVASSSTPTPAAVHVRDEVKLEKHATAETVRSSSTTC